LILLNVNNTLNSSPNEQGTEQKNEGESVMNIERIEHVLSTIDMLGAVSVKQLHEILKLGSYRYTCQVVNNIENYLCVERGKLKIVYLNKEGRELIGSDQGVKKSMMLNHMLLANDAYIHFDCPLDWKREYKIEVRIKNPVLSNAFVADFKGVNVPTKNKIVPDAVFTRNGYVYLVEIDNIRKMLDNRKKIERYKEMWIDIKQHFNAQPKLCIFTKSEKRKREFLKLCEKLPCEVFTFSEI